MCSVLDSQRCQTMGHPFLSVEKELRKEERFRQAYTSAGTAGKHAS